MVQVAFDIDHLVVRTIAIDHESLMPGHLARQPCPVELIAEPQLGRPFEDEEDGIGRLDIKGELERWQHARPTVKHYLMPKLFGRTDVVMHVLRAACIFGDEVYEHKSHKPKSPEHASQLWMISINLRKRAECECFSVRCRRISITTSQ